MDNSDTWVTCGHKHRTKTNKPKNTTQKLVKMNNMDLAINTGVNLGEHEGYTVP